jgi:HK97 family phage major capsid protein
MNSDRNLDYETKAASLEETFAAIESADLPGTSDTLDMIGQLREEVSALRSRVETSRRAGSRPSLVGSKSVESDAPARRFAEAYLRKGLQDGVELKAVTGTAGVEGGYAVPRELDLRIDSVLANISPIRSISTVVATGSSNYRKLVTTSGVASGWVSEADLRVETATPQFFEVSPPMGDLYANPAASQAMLDDAAFDIEGWLADEIATEFARAEGAAFVNGSGVNRPKGFLTYPTAVEPDATRTFGTIQYVASGAAGAFASASPQDKLIDLVHALKPAYRQGAVFVLNSATLARIRKMKDADGNFIWRPGLLEGQPDSLLGYPVVEAEDMPDVAANSFAIAFGNFQRAYIIVERSTTQILRDPFSHKPFVHFYATKRVGGALVNSEALKLMKFAAS